MNPYGWSKFEDRFWIPESGIWEQGYVIDGDPTSGFQWMVNVLCVSQSPESPGGNVSFRDHVALGATFHTVILVLDTNPEGYFRTGFPEDGVLCQSVGCASGKLAVWVPPTIQVDQVESILSPESAEGGGPLPVPFEWKLFFQPGTILPFRTVDGMPGGTFSDHVSVAHYSEESP